MDNGIKIDWLDIDEKFAAHAPKAEDAERYATINEAARNFAQVVFENTPRGHETDNAMRAIQEAALWAREAVLLTDRATPPRPSRVCFPDGMGLSSQHEFNMRDEDRWSEVAPDDNYWITLKNEKH